jgi:hypothetical protein
VLAQQSPAERATYRNVDHPRLPVSPWMLAERLSLPKMLSRQFPATWSGKLPAGWSRF